VRLGLVRAVVAVVVDGITGGTVDVGPDPGWGVVDEVTIN